MNRSFGFLLAGVIAVGLAVGAGLAAYQGAAGPSPAAQAAPRSPAASPVSSAGEQPGSGSLAGRRPGAVITGTVASANETGLTVKTDAGEQTIQLNAETTYRRSRPATMADLKAGETAVVVGEAGADGTVTARTIQVGQMVDSQRTPTRPSGQARLGAAGGQAFGRDRGIAFGTIQNVGPDSLTLDEPNGPAKIAVTPQTRIQRQEAATASDLKAGTAVVVTARATDGTPTAIVVQISEQ